MKTNMNVETVDRAILTSQMSSIVGIEEIILDTTTTRKEKIEILQKIYEAQNKIMDHLEKRINDLNGT